MLDSWLEAFERRHLASLTRSELTRALRALSSCYVERRSKLASGAALEGAGKRAAFALFYGPLHFLTIDRIVRASGLSSRRLTTIHDLGCGTGVGGAAWALACDTPVAVSAIDRNAWAVGEANWTFRQLGVRGHAVRGDIGSPTLRLKIAGDSDAVLLGYAVNELDDGGREALLIHVEKAVRAGAALLIVEPIARRLGHERWWGPWRAHLAPLGVREEEWRFPATLPPLVRDLGRAASLDPRELTARTLSTR